MSLTPVTVSANYRLPTGGSSPNPPVAQGFVTFQLITSMLASDGLSPVIVAAAPVQVTLRNGGFSVTLYANDDTTTTPAGTYYTVTELIGGEPANIYVIKLRYNDGPSISLKDCFRVTPNEIFFSTGGVEDESFVRQQPLDTFQPPGGALDLGGQMTHNQGGGAVLGDGASMYNMLTGWITESSGIGLTQVGSSTLPTILTVAGASFLTAAIYVKGIKVQWSDGTGTHNGVIASSSLSGSTLSLTLVPSADSIPGGTTGTPGITGFAYSSYANPLLFPTAFAWNPQPTGFSSLPTGSQCWWSVRGGMMTVSFYFTGNGTLNSSNLWSVTLPLLTGKAVAVPVFGTGAAGGFLALAAAGANATTMNIIGSGFTSGGAGNALFQASYPI